MSGENKSIRTMPAPSCFICGRDGSLLHENVRDSLFGAPGDWSLKKCGDPECGLLWLDPAPLEEDIEIAYAGYYTHDLMASPLSKLPRAITDAVIADRLQYRELNPGVLWKWLGRAMCAIPSVKDMFVLTLLGLNASDRGKILDIGCGSGRFLAGLKALGWECYGTDFDPEASESARRNYGLDVRTGSIEDALYPDGFFDIITMNHVIEHLHDPCVYLKECARILKPGGKISLTTPNAGSLGHRVFGKNWRGLEPPRHTRVYTSQALRKMAAGAGFSLVETRTTARNARHLSSESMMIAAGKNPMKESAGKAVLIAGYFFQMVEGVLGLFWKSAGEEIYFMARRP